MDDKFRAIISEELEISLEEVSESLELESGENWDSMAVICIITAIDDNYNIQIDDEKLAECKTVGEIYNLVSNH
jgi:acyl carrier protein|tara:strand:+ start:443 stop:664 length:222 start_codon:yes stop_codon:yes gene_type:complete